MSVGVVKTTGDYSNERTQTNVFATAGELVPLIVYLGFRVMVMKTREGKGRKGKETSEERREMPQIIRERFSFLYVARSSWATTYGRVLAALPRGPIPLYVVRTQVRLAQG